MAEYKLRIIVEGEDRASGPLGKATSALGRIGEFAAGGLITSGIQNITSGLVEMGSQALDSFANYERLTMSLETMSGIELMNAGVTDDMNDAVEMSQEHVQELLGWMQKLAIESPFNQDQVSSAYRLIGAYGFASDEAQRLTQAMVDFTAGSGNSGAMMDRIALALGQIQARGKVSAQELNQLSEAGINARKILADAFGVSTAAITEMIEQGLVPADLAVEAITQRLERDFGGAAKRQANTFSGLVSSLGDLKSVGLREFFTGTFTAVQPLLTRFVDYVTDPAVMASIRGWGDAFGNYLAGKLEYVEQLVGTISQSATTSGGLFAALGKLTGGEVQITAEGLITSVDWGSFVGTLDWTQYVATLQWSDFVATFAWREAVTSLRWNDFVLAFDWNDWIGTFAWGDFVSIVDWGNWVYTLSWGDYLLNLDWGNWIFSLQWGDYIYQLAWSDFINLFTWTDYAVSLSWGDFIGTFNWEDKVVSVDWGEFIGVFSWDRWIATIRWGDYVYRLAWSDFVDGISWSNYVLTLSWGDFLFSLDWNTWIATLAWGDFMSAADWNNWIYTLVWGDYVFQLDWGSWIANLAWGDHIYNLDWSMYLTQLQDWSAYISNLTWTDVITAFDDWSAYISNLTWTDIIVGVLDWATWVPALAWNEFVHLIDWAVWVIPLAWDALITAIDWGLWIAPLAWDSVVTETVSWGNYIVSLDWGNYISEALSWSGYVLAITWDNFVAKLEWPSFVEGFSWSEFISDIDWTTWLTAVEWSGFIASLTWSAFVPNVSWSSFISSINLANYIPSFPGWRALLGLAPATNADGTTYWRGGLTWVDERGPELFQFPDGRWALGSDQGAHLVDLPRGTKIYPHEDVNRLMGRGAMTFLGQNADGTSTLPGNPWPVQSQRPDLAQALKLGADYLGKKVDESMEDGAKKMQKAAEKWAQEFEGQLRKVPGLFGASQVTAEQMKLAELGIPQNFADDWLRRLTDEVVNGVDWEGVDIKDAALRAGLDPSLPAKAILELVTQKWNDRSLFADKANLELFNMEAVQTELARQAASAAGDANILALFGITPEQATGQAVALGGTMRTGIAQGLTGGTGGAGAAGGETGALFDQLLPTVTPEQFAPVGVSVVDALVTELGKDENKETLGNAIAGMFSGLLEKKDALLATGQAVAERIVKTVADAFGAVQIDLVGRLAATMQAQLTIEENISILMDLGGQFLELVYRGFLEAGAEKTWVDALHSNTSVAAVAIPGNATGTRNWRGGWTMVGEAGPELVNLPASSRIYTAGESRQMLAGAGDVYVTIQATINTPIDMRELGYQVAAEVRRRGR